MEKTATDSRKWLLLLPGIRNYLSKCVKQLARVDNMNCLIPYSARLNMERIVEHSLYKVLTSSLYQLSQLYLFEGTLQLFLVSS